MTEEKKQQSEEKNTDQKAQLAVAKSVYGEKKKGERDKRQARGKTEKQDEFGQRIVDLARVTRVMAGGKRMRFRACVVIGDGKGKVAVGLDKGADVTIAVNKAVNQAKKNIIEVPIVNDTIPHDIYHKKGAAKVLLKPARRGKGVIAGGATRIVLEMAGIKNITSKNLGTNNKVNIVKCAIEALSLLKKTEKKKEAEKKLEKVEAPKIKKTESNSVKNKN